MPRITASSVAEHRAAQIRTILDAAHDLLQETGAVPGLRHVAERAGLARSSMYQYFESRHDLLLALAADATPRWMARVESAMEQFENPVERALAYFDENIRLVSEGAHAAGDALAAEPGVEELMNQQAQELHALALKPLVDELEKLGVEDADQAATLLNSQLHAAGGMLSQGSSVEQVRTLLHGIIRPFLEANRSR